MRNKNMKAPEAETVKPEGQAAEVQEGEKKKTWTIKDGELVMAERKLITVDLQAVISARAKDIFPEGDKKAVFPRRLIALPERVEGESLDVDYPYAIFFLARELAEAKATLDAMIKIGCAEIEVGDKILWLHAVQHSISRDLERKLYKVELTYIFRIRELPPVISEEKILEEVK